MSVSITITGELKLDQTAGLQDDDVPVDIQGGAITGGLSDTFETFLNGLGLSTEQKEFAALVEGASDPDLVSITPDAGETIGKIFFSSATGDDFAGEQVAGVTTIGGAPVYLWSALGGKVVLVSTSNVALTADSLVAAFYIEPSNADHTTALVQSITFQALFHSDPNNPDDTIDFSNILRVAAVVTTPVPIEVDDDAPTIVVSGNEPTLTTDDTNIIDVATANFAGAFISDPGTDGLGAAGITYALGTPGGDSGLIATVLNESIELVNNGGVIEGRTATTHELAFTVQVDSAGNVTLTQLLAVRHDPDSGPDQETSLLAALVTLTATITDADGDQASDTALIGDNLVFKDDAPSIDPTGTPPTVTVDETNLNVMDTKNFAGNFTHVTGNDGLGSSGIDYALSTNGDPTGLVDTATGQPVTLALVGGAIEARNTDGDLVFKITVDDNGNVTLDQSRAVGHADPTDPNDAVSLIGNNLVTLTAIITDGDGDQDTAAIDITQSFVFTDDSPEITVPSSAPDAAHAAHLGNEAGQSVTGDIGWDVGNDPNGGSDFVATPTLTGSVELTGAILNPVVTAGPEDAHSASFNFSFHFDSDPITAGVQDGTAAGTLTFNKDTDQFTVTMTDPVEGFSFEILHTTDLLSKEPTSNTGHPEIVVERLAADDPNTPANENFYVQFTANNTPLSFTNDGEGSSSDTSYNFGAHELASSNAETWVSATQTTNGVAGDTIQKGELLTLRFFDNNVGIATEATDPTAKAGGIAIKFDGVGASEDLILILDLKDANGNEITRAVTVNNSDIFKTGQVPAPYNTEFSLDNNDGLVVVEANDYNLAGETYQIQGIQIMQSANGLTGSGINLNGAVGVNGGSVTNNAFTFQSLTDASFGNEQDVLKITDIGFIQTTNGFQDAALDFAFQIKDGDNDVTGLQHVNVATSNDFIV